MSRASRAALLGLLLLGCSDAPQVAPGPSCAEALRNSASASGVQAENIEPAIKQCELEKWSAALKTCIQTAPAGADLDATCFAKFKKR